MPCPRSRRVTGEVLTRTHGAILGTCARVEGVFSAISMHLAHRLDARRIARSIFQYPCTSEFLRSVRVELSHIMGVFTTFAVAFPEYAWSLRCDGRPLFELAAGSFRDRLLALYGQDVMAELEHFDGEGLSGRVWGSIRHDRAAGRRSYRLFVNRRPVRSASLYRAAHAAIGGAGMLLLFLEVAPEVVDINVHPAKREVRFRDEEGVYDLAFSALSRVLARGRARGASVAEDEAVYMPSTAGTGETFQAIGQIEHTFLLASAQGHLYLIDQHAAHERVLYDQLLDAIARGTPPRRQLMAPQVSCWRPASCSCRGAPQMLEACGFTLDQFGPGAVAIRTIPEAVPVSQAEVICRRLVQRLRDTVTERRHETLPQMLACLAAMKAGTPLALSAQQQLLRDWEISANPSLPISAGLFPPSLDDVRRKIAAQQGV